MTNQLCSSLLILILFSPISYSLPFRRLSSINIAQNEGEINDSHGISNILYQGDIAINYREKRSIFRQKNKKWKLPMPFSFDPKFPKIFRHRVYEAMRFWSEKTCIKFEENSMTFPRVNIFEGNGCWSFVGKQSNMRRQSLSLGSTCTDHVFVIAHEIAHTLGFYHEHARSDRDNYIQIDYSNVKPNLTFAFEKESNNIVNSTKNPYEYGSVMHYSIDQFAKNSNKPVIFAKDAKFAQTMGNRMRATFNDITKMNNLYNCHERCSNTVNRCKYGGYPAPNDCSQCICPDGFGGLLCETIEASTIGQHNNPNCGAELWATNQFQQFYGIVKTRVHSNRFLASPEHCFWHIKSSKEFKSIEIRIKNIISPCSMACSFNAIELKLSNFTMTGLRFCCDQHIYTFDGKSKSFYSDGPLVVIGAFARYDYIDFNIEYRAV